MYKKKIKIAIIGNCQVRPISQMLSLLNPNIEVISIAIVHLMVSENREEYWRFFNRADLIITQLIADTYPCEFVQTNFLKKYFDYKIIKIVNLYYLGYTPDLMYIRNTTQGTLKSPLGEYHNKTFFEAFKKGLSIQDAMQNYNNYDYNKEQYSGIAEKSLEELKKREYYTDIQIADFIEERLAKERLFFVFNHPSKKLLLELAKKILLVCGIKIERTFNIKNYKEPLDKIIVPINIYEKEKLYNSCDNTIDFQGVECNIASNNKVIVSSFRKYTLLEIVEKFYEVYENTYQENLYE